MNGLKIILSSAAYRPSRTSEIEKDSEGYYKVRLGAFNVFNSSGAFYTDKGIRDLLVNNKNSIFYRRLKKGYLLGEMDHPAMKPGMSIPQFMNRNARIDMDNVAFHIKDIELNDTKEQAPNSPLPGNVIIVEGWVKPAGPKGIYLQEALDNPNRNVAFSVRSISKDREYKGIIIKDTIAVFTWDFVTEPGINNANTFDMLNNKNINTESLKNIIDLEIKESDVNGMIQDIDKAEVNQESKAYMLEVSNEIMTKAFKLSDAKQRVLAW